MTKNPESVKEIFPVVYMPWEEVDVGWGDRPDGYSLHLNEAHRVSFLEEYWTSMPINQPSEYSSPLVFLVRLIDVNQAIYTKVRNSKNGIRIYN